MNRNESINLVFLPATAPEAESNLRNPDSAK